MKVNRTIPRFGLLILLALVVVVGLPACRTAPPPASNVATAEQSRPGRRTLGTTAYNKWRHCYRLTNEVLNVVVVPEIGRIMHLGIADQPNLLHQEERLRGKRARPDRPWLNFGGDWFWPVAQSRWTSMAAADWPPPAPLADTGWDADGWENEDGSQSCLLMRRYGPPINALVSRLITVDAAQPRVRITQRILGMGFADVPLVLWNVSQVAGVSRVFLPADPALPEGYRPLMFAPPHAGQVQRCADVLVVDCTAGGEQKLGSGPTNTWIAAQREGVLILERAERRGVSALSAPPVLPDGGCSVEMYTREGAGYAEIETLSPEASPQAGDTHENTLTIDVLPLPPELTACEAAARVRELVDQ